MRWRGVTQISRLRNSKAYRYVCCWRRWVNCLLQQFDKVVAPASVEVIIRWGSCDTNKINASTIRHTNSFDYTWFCLLAASLWFRHIWDQHLFRVPCWLEVPTLNFGDILYTTTGDIVSHTGDINNHVVARQRRQREQMILMMPPATSAP